MRCPRNEKEYDMHTSNIGRCLAVTAIVVLGCTSFAVIIASAAREANAMCPPDSETDVGQLMAHALSDDAAIAARATESLRAIGQPAVDALCAEHDRLMQDSNQNAPNEVDARATRCAP